MKKVFDVLEVAVDADTKKQAENIIDNLGLTPDFVVNMLYKEIVLQKKIPFDFDIPIHPLDISRMSEKEFNDAIQKGFDEVEAGLGIPAEEAFAQLRREYGI